MKLRTIILIVFLFLTFISVASTYFLTVNTSNSNPSTSNSQIFIFDDFESSLFKWNSWGTGTWIAKRDTTKAFNGEASMRLSTTPNADVSAERWNGFSRCMKKLKLELMWKHHQTNVPSEIRFGLRMWRNQVDRVCWLIRYIPSTGEWQIYTPDTPAWETILTKWIDTTEVIGIGWHYFSLEIDIEHLRYIALTINDEKIDLFDRQPRIESQTAHGGIMGVDLSVITGDVDGIAWFDDILVTEFE